MVSYNMNKLHNLFVKQTKNMLSTQNRLVILFLSIKKPATNSFENN